MKRKLWGAGWVWRGREERGLQDQPRGSSLRTAACTVIPDGVGAGLHVRRSAGLGCQAGRLFIHKTGSRTPNSQANGESRL